MLYSSVAASGQTQLDQEQSETKLKVEVLSLYFEIFFVYEALLKKVKKILELNICLRPLNCI